MSDFHASGVVPYKFLERAIDLGISLEPDIICLTGDYATHFYSTTNRALQKDIKQTPQSRAHLCQLWQP